MVTGTLACPEGATVLRSPLVGTRAGAHEPRERTAVARGPAHDATHTTQHTRRNTFTQRTQVLLVVSASSHREGECLWHLARLSVGGRRERLDGTANRLDLREHARRCPGVLVDALAICGAQRPEQEGPGTLEAGAPQMGADRLPGREGTGGYRADSATHSR